MIVPGRATRGVRVTRRRGADSTSAKDVLAVEEPLEIRVRATGPNPTPSQAIAVTMRTPGNDFELVAGFLHGEGVIRAADDLIEMSYCRGGEEQEYNVVEASLTPGVAFDLEELRRNVYTTSSCGVCGKASLEAVERVACSTLEPGPTVEASLIPGLPDRLLEAQGVFERTGGLHAAGLFSAGGERVVVREDVGRHNALDKVIGHTVLERVDRATTPGPRRERARVL